MVFLLLLPPFLVELAELIGLLLILLDAVDLLLKLCLFGIHFLVALLDQLLH